MNAVHERKYSHSQTNITDWEYFFLCRSYQYCYVLLIWRTLIFKLKEFVCYKITWQKDCLKQICDIRDWSPVIIYVEEWGRGKNMLERSKFYYFPPPPPLSLHISSIYLSIIKIHATDNHKLITLCLTLTLGNALLLKCTSNCRPPSKLLHKKFSPPPPPTNLK